MSDSQAAAPPDTLRLAAEVVFDPGAGRGVRWLRILGDDLRGYLLVGDLDPEGGPALTEFWHPTLDLALAAAAAVGVPPSAWDREQAPPRPRRRGTG
jgi:hypothetical protein